jgi:hypothetical protein
MASPFDGTTEDEELENAATVLMTGSEVKEEMRQLRELYKRRVTGEVPLEEPPESESEVAAFRLVAEEDSLQPGMATLERPPLSARAEPSRPWGLYATGVVVAAALVGAAALLV